MAWGCASSVGDPDQVIPLSGSWPGLSEGGYLVFWVCEGRSWPFLALSGSNWSPDAPDPSRTPQEVPKAGRRD